MILPSNLRPYEEITLSSEAVEVLKSKEKELAEGTVLLTSKLFQLALQNSSSNSISFEESLKEKVIAPSKEVIANFEERVKTIFDKAIAQLYPAFAEQPIVGTIKQTFSLNDQMIKETFQAAASDIILSFINDCDRIDPELLKQRYHY